MDLLQTFQTAWVEKLDQRVAHLTLVSSSYHVPLIMLAYIYFVFDCGPRFMRNRPAYSLKTFIQLYNIVQIFGNMGLVYEFINAGVFARSQFCPTLDFHNDIPIRFIRCGWYYMVLKILDYVETTIFILRKKDKQVSFLHLYHHISTLLLAWLNMRYILLAPVFFMCMLNTIIHVMMYTYYFLAACGPEIQKSIITVKRYITILQMVQFVIIILYAMQNFIPTCQRVPHIAAIFFILNIVINFYLFYNFYQKTYKKPSQKVQ